MATNEQHLSQADKRCQVFPQGRAMRLAVSLAYVLARCLGVGCRPKVEMLPSKAKVGSETKPESCLAVQLHSHYVVSSSLEESLGAGSVAGFQREQARLPAAVPIYLFSPSSAGYQTEETLCFRQVLFRRPSELSDDPPSPSLCSQLRRQLQQLPSCCHPYSPQVP